MANDTFQAHPCDGREALAPWQPDHLYVNDDGQILCGRCQGVESTYKPWAWSDLGPMNTDRSVTIDGTKHRCETDRYTHRRLAG